MILGLSIVRSRVLKKAFVKLFSAAVRTKASNPRFWLVYGKYAYSEKTSGSFFD